MKNGTSKKNWIEFYRETLKNPEEFSLYKPKLFNKIQLQKFKHLELHLWSKSGMLETFLFETRYFCTLHTAEERVKNTANVCEVYSSYVIRKHLFFVRTSLCYETGALRTVHGLQLWHMNFFPGVFRGAEDITENGLEKTKLSLFSGQRPWEFQSEGQVPSVVDGMLTVISGHNEAEKWNKYFSGLTPPHLTLWSWTTLTKERENERSVLLK